MDEINESITKNTLIFFLYPVFVTHIAGIIFFFHPLHEYRFINQFTFFLLAHDARDDFYPFFWLWFCYSSFCQMLRIRLRIVCWLASWHNILNVIVAIPFYRTYLSIELESSAFNTHIKCIIFHIHAIILYFLSFVTIAIQKAIIKFSLSPSDRHRITSNALN